MTYRERQIVAEILALPDGPWEPWPGYKTAAEWASEMEFAASHNRQCREGRHFKVKQTKTK